VGRRAAALGVAPADLAAWAARGELRSRTRASDSAAESTLRHLLRERNIAAAPPPHPARRAPATLIALTDVPSHRLVPLALCEHLTPLRVFRQDDAARRAARLADAHPALAQRAHALAAHTTISALACTTAASLLERAGVLEPLDARWARRALGALRAAATRHGLAERHAHLDDAALRVAAGVAHWAAASLVFGLGVGAPAPSAPPALADLRRLAPFRFVSTDCVVLGASLTHLGGGCALQRAVVRALAALLVRAAATPATAGGVDVVFAAPGAFRSTEAYAQLQQRDALAAAPADELPLLALRALARRARAAAADDGGYVRITRLDATTAESARRGAHELLRALATGTLWPLLGLTRGDEAALEREALEGAVVDVLLALTREATLTVRDPGGGTRAVCPLRVEGGQVRAHARLLCVCGTLDPVALARTALAEGETARAVVVAAEGGALATRVLAPLTDAECARMHALEEACPGGLIGDDDDDESNAEEEDVLWWRGELDARFACARRCAPSGGLTREAWETHASHPRNLARCVHAAHALVEACAAGAAATATAEAAVEYFATLANFEGGLTYAVREADVAAVLARFGCADGGAAAVARDAHARLRATWEEARAGGRWRAPEPASTE